MKMKKLLLIVSVISIISLFGCGNTNDATLPVNAETMPEVTETMEETEPIQEEEPEPEPVEEEEEPEEDEDKPLDLDSLDSLKWVMGAFVNLNYDYSAFCSGEKSAIESLLWDMDYYSGVEYPDLPKGEEFAGPRDEYGVADGFIRFTIEQAQVAVNSLTGRQVDISSVGENGVIELWAVGLIEEDTVCKNWNTEYIGNNTWKVYVDKYRYGQEYDEDTLYKESEFTFTVIENPDSIFDGYSIIEVEALKVKEVPRMSEQAKEHINSYGYLDEDTFNEFKKLGEFEEYNDYSEYQVDVNASYLDRFENEEPQEELEGDVLRDANINESEMLYKFDRSTTTVTIDDLPQTLHDNVVFNLIREDDACALYEASLNYFGDVTSIEPSDWLTTVMYSSAYADVYIINGEHYKFIFTFDESTLYITDQI